MIIKGILMADIWNLLKMLYGSGISSQSLVEAKGWLQKMNEKTLR